MALSRKSNNRVEASMWPGFVDAMTALLLILFFVLSIFMIVQFALKETITGQETELDSLTVQLADLADALGLERAKSQGLDRELGLAQQSLNSAEARIADQLAQITLLNDQTAAQAEQIVAFEAQIAGLLVDKEKLEGENNTLLTQKEAVELALASARNEIDAGAEAARLAAAKREALEALVASLEKSEAEKLNLIGNLEDSLSQAEKDRLAEAAAAEALRARLKSAEGELTAVELALDAQLKEAQETLTLLAAANASKEALEASLDKSLSEEDRTKALLATANSLLDKEKELASDSQRQLALLNAQTGELRGQLRQLQGLLDQSQENEREAEVQLQALGQNLNAALARVAAEEKARADLEEKERLRLAQEAETLAEEAKSLARFKSDFFGAMRELLENVEGVRIVGDRFVFSSEVLFGVGSAELGLEGRVEIAKVARIINDISDQIPNEIDWVLRVDGHTDKDAISPSTGFADNWELSQARALSVVRFMVSDLGFAPDRLAANGFGEFQPIDPSDTPEAFAQNRRIELKFTEK